MKDHLKGFDDACGAGRAIFIVRQAEYGPGSIEAGGVLAAVMELEAIVRRLKNMIGDPQPTKERLLRIEDALTDAHNYANIGSLMLQNSNLRGDY